MYNYTNNSELDARRAIQKFEQGRFKKSNIERTAV